MIAAGFVFSRHFFVSEQRLEFVRCKRCNVIRLSPVTLGKEGFPYLLCKFAIISGGSVWLTKKHCTNSTDKILLNHNPALGNILAIVLMGTSLVIELLIAFERSKIILKFLCKRLECEKLIGRHFRLT